MFFPTQVRLSRMSASTARGEPDAMSTDEDEDASSSVLITEIKVPDNQQAHLNPFLKVPSGDTHILFIPLSHLRFYLSSHLTLLPF